MKIIKLKRTIIALITAALCIILSGCGREKAAPETEAPETDAPEARTDRTDEDQELYNAGVYTPIEILGYSRYTGPNADRFLKEGDKIAVISPSALPSREQADAVIKGLEEWGYVPVEGKYVCTEGRTLENCREDLVWALTDPEIKGIFCVRGGWAASEVMDTMDLDLIKEAKKPIIGYSDISAYHAGWTTAGLTSVHASMSAAFTDLPEECADAEEHILKGEIPSYRCKGSRYDNPGTAKGVLVGGNLTVMLTVVNTSYDSTVLDEPYILLLEDVDSSYLNTHCCLTVLKNSGVLDRASGIILGEWNEFRPETNDYDGGSRGGRFSSVYDMIYRQFLKDLDVPIAYGFPAGHGEYNYPLLMGAEVRLDVGDDGFTLEWMDTETDQ
ncbi:MAG: LD-carboxypeptidase [Lachnospiraceae bacterium]|nr:LD-carboxypeptidase [Lachnospiraceae bacterium]